MASGAGGRDGGVRKTVRHVSGAGGRDDGVRKTVRHVPYNSRGVR